jgi:hypothetical protein
VSTEAKAKSITPSLSKSASASAATAEDPLSTCWADAKVPSPLPRKRSTEPGATGPGSAP